MVERRSRTLVASALAIFALTAGARSLAHADEGPGLTDLQVRVMAETQAIRGVDVTIVPDVAEDLGLPNPLRVRELALDNGPVKHALSVLADGRLLFFVSRHEISEVRSYLADQSGRLVAATRRVNQKREAAPFPEASTEVAAEFKYWATVGNTCAKLAKGCQPAP
jgi:hypothetical protein